MENLLDAENQIETWQEVTLVYNAALKQINTRLEILNDEFQHVHQYNPIEHIKSRIKTSESIVKKLKRHGYESTIENMVKYVNDIAGVRIICSFTSDIYRIAEMIRLQSDMTSDKPQADLDEAAASTAPSSSSESDTAASKDHLGWMGLILACTTVLFCIRRRSIR